MHGTAIPSQAELPILRALWALGTATSADVLDAVRDEPRDYSSAYIKVYLRRMTLRGLVQRAERSRGTGRPWYAYSAAHSREAMGTLMLMGE